MWKGSQPWHDSADARACHSYKLGTPIMENQMEKQMENCMEARDIGVIFVS